ncbi:MAG: dipeptide epimerase [Acidobacteriota bacterium]
MKIVSAASRNIRIPLTRPYAIAGGSWDMVEMVLLELTTDDGRIGYGQASPAEEVTGETAASAEAALAPRAIDWLIGCALKDLEFLLAELPHRVNGPAARAAVDMALFDLEGKRMGLPLVERLTRVHHTLSTSITIGIKSVEETLSEAEEYLARGFRVLKIKTGAQVDFDIERLAMLRERFGAQIVLRADANQGYDLPSLHRVVEQIETLDLDLLEQPLPPALDHELRAFPPALRRRFVADESVHDESDLMRLIGDGCPFGVLNIKLMKCGGVAAAIRLAQRAERAGMRLMWGCMDESVLGIAAALHAALACDATAYLDLDGSFDLTTDPFSGGFRLEGDCMSTLARPGLGATPTS